MRISDKTAAELSIVRIQGEINDLTAQRRKLETLTETRRVTWSKLAVGGVFFVVGTGVSLSWVSIPLFLIAALCLWTYHNEFTKCETERKSLEAIRSKQISTIDNRLITLDLGLSQQRIILAG